VKPAAVWQSDSDEAPALLSKPMGHALDEEEPAGQ